MVRAGLELATFKFPNHSATQPPDKKVEMEWIPYTIE